MSQSLSRPSQISVSGRQIMPQPSSISRSQSLSTPSQTSPVGMQTGGQPSSTSRSQSLSLPSQTSSPVGLHTPGQPSSTWLSMSLSMPSQTSGGPGGGSLVGQALGGASTPQRLVGMQPSSARPSQSVSTPSHISVAGVHWQPVRISIRAVASLATALYRSEQEVPASVSVVPLIV